MDWISIISCLFSILYLYQGILIFSKDRKAPINRLYLWINVIFSFWAFTYAFVLAAPTEAAVWPWYKVSSLGWCSIPSLSLHLGLVVSGIMDRLKPRWLIYTVLYLPAVVFVGLVQIGYPVIATGFKRIGDFWFEVNSHSLGMYIFVAFYGIYMALTMVSILKWGMTTKLKRERRQVQIVTVSAMLAFLLGLCFNIVLPALGIFILPAVGYIFISVWLSGMAIAIGRYKLLVLTTSMASDQIMDRVKDFIVLTDPHGNVVKLSATTYARTGWSPEEVIGQNARELVTDGDELESLFLAVREISLKKGEEISLDEHSRDTHMVMKNGEDPIPVRISGAPIRDRVSRDLLGVVFAAADMRITRELQGLNQNLSTLNADLSEAHELAERDLSMAANVQGSLFPTKAPVDENWDTAFFFHPASKVAGDLYDFYVINGEFRGVALLDVSGHGISSGLITLLSKSILARRFFRNQKSSLGKVMEKFNEDLCDEIDTVENYLTGIVLRFNGDRVEYCSAAHPDLLYRSGATGRVSVVKNKNDDFKGTLLGIDALKGPYKGLSFQVKEGDLLLIYSDCLNESVNPDGEPFGDERIHRLLERCGGKTAAEALDGLLAAFYEFTGTDELDDDLTLILLKRK